MPHVLVVDDSLTIRRMVKMSLSRLPGEPVFYDAASGLEAIERLSVSPVDLMVLDLNMPDMHGLEVLAFLRGHHRYRGVPVIVLTTRSDDSARDSALRAGATSFMTKPFTPGDLAAAAGKLLASAGTGAA
jgi:two-component system, chemotaxis family, chemotaxis protein CheY